MCRYPRSKIPRLCLNITNSPSSRVFPYSKAFLCNRFLYNKVFPFNKFLCSRVFLCSKAFPCNRFPFNRVFPFNKFPYNRDNLYSRTVSRLSPDKTNP